MNTTKSLLTNVQGRKKDSEQPERWEDTPAQASSRCRNGDRQEAEYDEVCPGKGSTSYPRNLGAVPKLPQYYNLIWREGSSKSKIFKPAKKLNPTHNSPQIVHLTALIVSNEGIECKVWK